MFQLNKEKPTILLQLINGSRFLSVLAILSSLAGGLFLFVLGTWDTFLVFYKIIIGTEVVQGEIEPSVAAIIDLLETLDEFLVGLALLYFAYGIYCLFHMITLSINIS
jgi:uncharacterized membrane protein YqhA